MTSTLLTDLYQLTMAAGYWKHGMAERQSVFHLFFRKLPFAGGYAVAAGLADVVAWLQGFSFSEAETAYLGQMQGRDGKPLFETGFLQYLSELKWTCDVDAMPEGTVVFPHQPLIRITGPLVQAQLAETALLNMINFQTLIATKAARVCEAAQGEPVLEFGLRRAQGPDGAVMASRAAFLGGCHATSNVLAGMKLGIPVKGTHAHSWVMSFDTEREAFAAYAAAMPNNCVFLVDTYNTLEGVRHAVETGLEMRKLGHEMAGIRLDSGDLAYLSIQAREILDAGGFPHASIVASNDLDEHLIEALKHQGAKISVWGVGTKLVTGGEQSALGGVYKLGAVQDDAGCWQPKIKLSEQVVKVSNPGILQVRRFSLDGEFCGDALYDTLAGCNSPTTIHHPEDLMKTKAFPAATQHEDLIQPVFRQGRLMRPCPTLVQSQQYATQQRASLSRYVKRLQNPHSYPAGIEHGLLQQKQALIASFQPTIS
jgi:nicotinate phosphoribosyltransferase